MPPVHTFTISEPENLLALLVFVATAAFVSAVTDLAARRTSQAARAEIAEAAEHPVHLFLFVKVRANWADDPERYREMGLEFPRG